MKDNNVIGLAERAKDECWTTLEQIARTGARQMLAAALENEVEEYLQSYDPVEGRARMVRNGYHRQRSVQTGLGPIEVKAPRVRDREGTEKFTSAILPKFLRRVASVDNLIPALYLRGVSTGNMEEALEAILGEGARGLSPTNIGRLKTGWEADYRSWNSRDLSGKQYVYWWVDGIYFNVRLDEQRSCVLVVMGATNEGKKEIVAVVDGYRESKDSWREVLLDLKKRGLDQPPKLCVGDGALGFWSAVSEVYPAIRTQRCWVHKTANVLDKMPKSVQGRAKEKLHAIYLAPTRKEGYSAFDHFIKCYRAKYPKAVECLEKDRDSLMAFYDFPAEHWQHIRSTNPIESTFATVRHRHRQTKGCGSRIATLTMVFKLAESAQKRWRRLKGHHQIEKIIKGIQFKDGEEVLQEAA